MSIDYNPLTSFKIGTQSPLLVPIFMGDNGCAGVARTDAVKYPIFQKQADRMFEAFWKKTEINLTRDKRDYTDLNPIEQTIWRETLQSQIVMDSSQGASLVQAFMPITTDPMVKRCLNYIEFFEELHSDTYEYIVKNVIDPSAIFDGMADMQYLVDRSKSITTYYDNLLTAVAKYRLGMTDKLSVKKHAWLGLQSINALEAIRFFISFACSFAFGETGRMVGNASLIKLIANDELMHVAFTTALLRILPKDDTDFARIKEEMAEESRSIFLTVEHQEKDTADYIFRDGDLMGLSKSMAVGYLQQRTAKSMRAVEMEYPYEVPKTNFIPYMGAWLNDGDNQPPPQEVKITSYVHAVQSDIEEDTFDAIEL